MEFLYDERGRLLHYFKATNRFNPFTEDAHQPVAFLAMSVGCHAILQKTVAINQTMARPNRRIRSLRRQVLLRPHHHVMRSHGAVVSSTTGSFCARGFHPAE